MGKYINKIRKKYKETGKKSLLVYLILRILVIACMVLQILRGDWNNAFLCFLSLILFTIPTFIEDRFKIALPSLLEAIIYLFIFSAEILGEINNSLMLKISNDKISFLQNGIEVAYMTDNKLYITDGEFLNSLQLGNFAFYPRSSGNLSFKKIK